MMRSFPRNSLSNKAVCFNPEHRNLFSDRYLPAPMSTSSFQHASRTPLERPKEDLSFVSTVHTITSVLRWRQPVPWPSPSEILTNHAATRTLALGQLPEITRFLGRTGALRPLGVDVWALRIQRVQKATKAAAIPWCRLRHSGGAFSNQTVVTTLVAY